LKIPGETKNLAKGYGRSLANFINSIIHDCNEKHEIKQLAENPTL
jgi:hypothetical protein